MPLSPINLGPVTIDEPVILAPMSGVTDLPFRRLARRLGAGMVVSEMVASNEALRHTDATFKRLMRTEAGEVQSVQIAGFDPVAMAETARFAADLGADIIDINFGCPAKKVTNRFCGSALMRDMPQAARIMEAVVGAARVDHGRLRLSRPRPTRRRSSRCRPRRRHASGTHHPSRRAAPRG